ncbi:unnamed protein product [Vicia faba]|uniref:PPPDE domain-containing protein n=1 Tax=Vicia faba TaxID=3906 RepID=A0AAV0ZBX1_VICFA|nr:unnamed protein product [Vicia faba]
MFKIKVNQIVKELSREWPGSAFDLLSKNCNHFCDEFCERVDVPKLPDFGIRPCCSHLMNMLSIFLDPALEDWPIEHAMHFAKLDVQRNKMFPRSILSSSCQDSISDS